MLRHGEYARPETVVAEQHLPGKGVFLAILHDHDVHVVQVDTLLLLDHVEKLLSDLPWFIVVRQDEIKLCH